MPETYSRRTVSSPTLAGECCEPDQFKAFTEALLKGQKERLVLCPCLGTDLARSGLGLGQSFKGVKVSVMGT